MSKKNKLLIALLSVTCLGAVTFGLTACGKSNGNSSVVDSTLLSKYNSYVEDAKANNQEYLSYEQWLFTTVQTDTDTTNKWLTGTEAPASSLGNDGDLYLDTSSWNVYTKSNGAWVLQGNIKGENGIDGTNGTNGIDGTDGTNGTNGVGVESIYVNSNNEVVALYEDGTTSIIYKIGDNGEIIQSDTFTMYAKDNNNKPVANAYFTLYIYENYTATDVMTAKSNSNGVVKFNFFPEVGKNYKIKSADADTFVNAVPSGYTTRGVYDSVLEWYSSSADISESTSPTFYFNDIENSLIGNNASDLDIGYKRYYNLTTTNSTAQAKSEGIYEDNQPYYFKVTSGHYKYFLLSPSVSPSAYTNDNAVTDERWNMMYEAAAGTYQITITSTNNKAVLYYYDGTYSSLANRANALDSNGIPTDSVIEAITGTAPAGSTDTRYTGTNSITINFDKDIASGNAVFGIYASQDSTVTITITRIGDATTPVAEEIVVEPTKATAFTTEFGSSDNLILAPIDGSYDAFLGDDGYYHLGSKTGPILYAQLTNIVSRYNEGYAISFSSNDVIGWSRIYTINDSNNRPIYRYYYADFISTYASRANSKGYYPVNEELKDFLEKFKGYSSNNDYSWLLPCYYVEPEGGLALNGSGTEADPYVLHNGTNTVTITEGTYFSFTSDDEAAYTFKVNSKDSSYDITSLVMDVVNGSDTQISQATYKELVTGTGYVNYMGLNVLFSRENETRIFTLTGSGTFVIEVSANASAKSITPVSSSGNTSSGYEESAKYSGISVSSAIAVTGSGTVFVTFDTSACAEGVYISFRTSPLAMGYYTFDIGSMVGGKYVGGYIVYNGGIYQGHELTFYADDVEDSTADVKVTKTYTMLLVNKDAEGNNTDGEVMLSIYKVGTSGSENSSNTSFITSGGETEKNFVTLGADTEISITDSQAYWGTEYSFTALETGYYKLSIVSGENVNVYDTDEVYSTDDPLLVKGSEEFDDNEEFVFKLKAGKTFTFSCSVNPNSEGEYKGTTYTLHIEKTTAPIQDNYTFVVGEELEDVTIPTEGLSGTITIETAGTYTVKMKAPAAYINNYYFMVVIDNTTMLPLSHENDYTMDIALSAGTHSVTIGAVDLTTRDDVEGGFSSFVIKGETADTVLNVAQNTVTLYEVSDYEKNTASSYTSTPYYTFTATATGTYKISTDTHVVVYDSNNNLIIDGDEPGTFQATEGDVIKLKFLAENDYTVNTDITVTISLVSTISITLDEATEITIPSYTSGTIEVDLSGEGTYTVTLSGENVTGNTFYLKLDSETKSRVLNSQNNYSMSEITLSGTTSFTMSNESDSAITVTITVTKNS